MFERRSVTYWKYLPWLILLLVAAVATSRVNAESADHLASQETPKAEPLSTCAVGWHVASSPNVGTTWNMLTSVAVVSATDIWAVGNYSNQTDYSGPSHTLTMHWDGNQWSVIPSPDAGPDGNGLSDVTAISTNDVWAVGRYDAAPGPEVSDRTQTMHWDGSRWSIVPSPNPFGGEGTLNAVSGVSPNDVWAVGYGHPGIPPASLTMHWDGSRWSIVPVPPGPGPTCYLFDVEAITSNHVWAVGYCDNVEGPPYWTFAIHWNGSQWNVVPTQNPGTSSNFRVFLDVEALAPDDVWAVGYYHEGETARTMVQHWDGNSWSLMPSPSVGPINALAVLSPNDIWAVGLVGDLSNSQPQILHWDGTAWSIVPSPNVGQGFNTLIGVAAISPDLVWAVGFKGGRSGFMGAQTLVEHYGSRFSDVPGGSAFYPYIHCLACQGLVSGYDDGTFRPGSHITRSQLSKLVSNAAGFSDDPGSQIFEDVPPGNPFYQWIQRLARRGIIGGYQCGGPGEPCRSGNRPYFRPHADATRGQVAKIVSDAAGFGGTPVGQTFEDVPPSSPFYLGVERLAARYIVSGYRCGGPGEPCGPISRPYFRWDEPTTRGQASKIVSSAFFPDCSVPDSP